MGEADQMGSVEIQAEGGACIFEGGGDAQIVGVRQLDLLRTVAQQPASAAAHKLPFLCLILTGNRCETAGGNIGSLKIHACASFAAAVGLGDNFRQNELRAVINEQILVTADQFTLICHQGISPLGRRAAGGGRYLFAGRSDLLVQRQRIGRADSGGVGGILRVVGMLHVIDTGGLQIMGAIGRVAADGDIIVRDGEGGHGQRLVHIAGVRVTVVAHIAGIQIGEGQRFFLKLGLAALGNVDLIALGQEDGSAAQIVIPAVRMVVAEHEDDVQAGIARLVQHIKDVIGVHAVTVVVGTHAVVQRQMGHHKNGLGILCIALGIQIALQRRSRILDRSLIAVAPHIVIFIDDKHAVLGRIMGAAGSQSACSRSIMVALYKHHTVICQGAICAGYCIL